MAYPSLFIHTATIERATRTVDSGGDTNTQWQTVASNVPCRLDERHVRTSIAPIGEILGSEWVGLFPPETDLRPRAGESDGDRLTIDAVRYRVVGVMGTDPDRRRPVEAILERTEGLA